MTVMPSSRSLAQEAEKYPFRAATTYLNLLFLLILVLRCTWIFATPLRAHDLPLRMVQDDFFYYLKPAQNLAWHHRSTYFDGVLTNGYHPLYFLLLTGVSYFVHTLPGIFHFLFLLDVVSILCIFLLTRKMFEYFNSPLLANAIGLMLAIVSIPLLCDQMEVTLALPMGIAFLLTVFVPVSQLTFLRLFIAGVLAALTMLSRLDAVVLVALYLVGALFTREYRKVFSAARIAVFCAGFLPLPACYLWINHHFFHTFLPISGMAKELRHTWRPSLLLPASINGTTELLVNVALAVGVLGWGMRRYLLPREKIMLCATVAFPFGFYGLEMLLSDWPIWNWYFYVLRFSCLSLGILVGVITTRSLVPARYPRLKSWLEGTYFSPLFCIGCVVTLLNTHYKVDHWMLEIQHAAGVLEEFASSHPGVYAMGDRAGMFGALTPSPVLQTEGLVMDRAYLEHIRNQENLRKVLLAYGVNYYVAFVFKTNERMQLSHSCFHAMEPSIAGPDALRMRADFCEPPVFQFPGADGRYFVFRVQP